MADYDLGTARGKIEIDASGAKKGVDEATKSTGELEGKTKGMGASAQTAGLALVGIGAAAVGAFAFAVKAAADFEKQLSGFKAVTGATTEQMDQIREKALQLGADTKFSASQAADAMVELGKQGLDVSQILDGAADATVNLAAAGEIELPAAAKIAAAALNQFKLSAKDLPEVADLLAGAANASATGVQELGDALSFVGPVAQAMGVSIDDTVGALALFANNGIDAGKSGTALRAILSRLVPASKEAAGTMKELGLITKDGSNQFFDAQGNAKSMRDVIEILNQSTKDLTAEQKIQALQTIFGTEALAAANIMAGTTGESFDQLQTKIGNVKAADVAAERMNNLSGSMEQLSGSIETVLIKAGSHFQVGLKGIVDLATGFVNILGNLNPEIQKWIGFIVAGAGAAALLVGGFLLLLSAIEKVKFAFAALSAIMAANPILIVIGIIIALVGAIVLAYNNIQVFRDAVDNLWANIQPIWEGIKNGVISAATAIGATLGPAVASAWTSIQTGGQTLVTWFSGTLVPAVSDFWTVTVQPAWQAYVDWVNGTFVPALQAAGTLVSESLKTAGDTISTAFSSPAAAEGINNLGTTISTVFTTVIGFLTGVVLPAISAFFAGFLEQGGLFLAWLGTTFGPLITALGELFSAVWTRIQQIVTIGMAFLMAIIGAAVVVIMAIWSVFGDDLIRIIQVAWDFIKQIIAAAVQIITGIVQVATAILTGDWGKAWDGIKNIAQGAWNAITAVITTAIELVFNVIRAIIGGIGAFMNGAWEGIKAVASAAWNAVVAVISSHLDRAKGIVTGAIDAIKSIFNVDLSAIGARIISSLINGIKSKIGEIQSTLSSITNLIPDWKGPPEKDAKLLVENGQLIMGGLASGLKDGWKDVEGLLGSMTSDISPSFGASGAGTTNSNVNVNFVINGSGSPSETQAMLGDPALLRKITNAARAGSI